MIVLIWNYPKRGESLGNVSETLGGTFTEKNNFCTMISSYIWREIKILGRSLPFINKKTEMGTALTFGQMPL